MNSSKQDTGLPDIAHMVSEKRSVVIILIVLVVACMGLFYWFSKQDTVKAKAVEETYSIASEPKTDMKQETKNLVPASNPAESTSPPVNAEIIQQQIALIQEKQKALQQRIAAPLMVVNTNTATSDANAKVQTNQPMLSRDPNMQFLGQVSAQSTDTAVATRLGPLNLIIAEGSFIHAILEPATNSDLPGYLRATVSEPSYAEDGSQILIPKGSRLIGEYKSGMLQGQSRIFIVWTRVITPDGISVQLGSPGVDSLGVAGMEADSIDRHFWQRFGTASLLSLISAGAATAGVNGGDQDNSAAYYREAVASSFAQTADQSLQRDARIPPTLKTYQGKPIMVFVARDLNFQNAISMNRPKTNVF